VAILARRASSSTGQRDANPQMLMPLVEIELRSGEIERARSLLARVGPGDSGSRRSLVELGWSFVDANPDTALSSSIPPSMAPSPQRSSAAASMLQNS
jgi:hypothetical protein